MLVSGIWQTDSVIHTFIIFPILFHNSLLQDTEHSSLCYTVGHCYIIVYISQSQTPNLPLSHLCNFLMVSKVSILALP